MDPNLVPNQPEQPVAPIEPITQPVQPTQPQPVAVVAPPVKKDKKGLLIKIAAGALVAALIVGGVCAYLWRDGQANRQKTDDAAKIKTLEDKITAMEAEAGPAVQDLLVARNDTQRKNDLARLATALVSYMSNNRGAIPNGTGFSTSSTWTSFAKNYLVSNGDTFTDPGGTNYILSDTATLPVTFTSSNPLIVATSGAICSGQNLTTGQGSRKVAFRMRLEGNDIACLNN